MSLNIPDGFTHNCPLKNLTTFSIGGPAKYFVEIKQVDDMQKLLAYCLTHKLPYLILGKGSNLLLDDRGFNGLVIANRIDFLNKKENNVWHVGAGYSFSLLGTQTARQGLSGLEFASGIPGSVGGAIFMNAGANGQETCNALISVDYVTDEGIYIEIDKEEIEFGYRFSTFQKKTGAIVGASFRLTPSLKAREEQVNLIQYRQKTQPYGDKSAGCVFRNPSGISAGALIEKTGLKGVSVGGAQVSNLHANFLVNTGEATANDVIDLIDLIKKEVKKSKGLELECEIRYIPYQEMTGIDGLE